MSDCQAGFRKGYSTTDNLFIINSLIEIFKSKREKLFLAFICDFNDDAILIYFKLFILLYADDTVIFGDSAENLQEALNSFKEYCNIWKLTVNVDKTKVLIISKRRPSSKLHFYFNNTELEIVKEYKYLGIFCHEVEYLQQQRSIYLSKLIKHSSH